MFYCNEIYFHDDSVHCWSLISTHFWSCDCVLLQADVDAAVQLLLKLKADYKQLTGQDYQAGRPPTDAVMNDEGHDDGDDQVDPWNVSTSSAKGVDYDKLIGWFVY